MRQRERERRRASSLAQPNMILWSSFVFVNVVLAVVHATCDVKILHVDVNQQIVKQTLAVHVAGVVSKQVKTDVFSCSSSLELSWPQDGSDVASCSLISMGFHRRLQRCPFPVGTLSCSCSCLLGLLFCPLFDLPFCPLCACVHVYVCVLVYLCICVSVYVCVHACVCVCRCVHVCACVHVCTCVRV